MDEVFEALSDSKLIEAGSGGWPLIRASLKSLLETGESLEATRRWMNRKCASK